MKPRTGWIVIAAIFVAALFLRHDLGLLALSTAAHDDLLFFSLAQSIKSGEWLGPYYQLTLAKGPLLPIAIATSSLLGLPFKTFEFALGLLAALAMASLLFRLTRSWALAILMFAALAFDPVAWGNQWMRLIREPLYGATSLGAFALFAGLVLERRTEPMPSWRTLASALGFGLVFAAFWLTREESVWLYPAFAVVLIYGLGARAKEVLETPRRALLSGAIIAGLSLAGVVAGLLPILLLNWNTYGAFATTEFRPGPFQEALGALSRIAVNRPHRYVLVPQAALSLAYTASPAAAELRPFLGEDGPAKGWMDVSCSNLPADVCGREIAAGWFMWALRDAAAAAGHYRSAADAADYFARLSKEINEACDRGRIPCYGPRDSFVPPLAFAEIVPLAKAALAGVSKIAQLETNQIAPKRSEGDAEALNQWRDQLGRVAPGGDVRPRVLVKGWVAGAASPAIVLSRGEDNTRTSVSYIPAPDVDKFLASAGRGFMTARRYAFSTDCLTEGCRMVVLSEGRITHQVPLSEPIPTGDGQLNDDVALLIDSAETIPVSGGRGLETVKYGLIRAYADIGTWVWPFLWITAALGVIFHVVVNRRDAGLNRVAVIAVASLAAVAGRLFILAYLEVTSWKDSVSELYLSPAYPLAIVFAVAGTYLLWRAARARPLPPAAA